MRVNESKVNKDNKKRDDNVEDRTRNVYEYNSEEPIHFWLCRKSQSKHDSSE